MSSSGGIMPTLSTLRLALCAAALIFTWFFATTTRTKAALLSVTQIVSFSAGNIGEDTYASSIASFDPNLGRLVSIDTELDMSIDERIIGTNLTSNTISNTNVHGAVSINL